MIVLWKNFKIPYDQKALDTIVGVLEKMESKKVLIKMSLGVFIKHMALNSTLDKIICRLFE